MMIEALSYGLVIASDDRMEGVTAFLEKRTLNFPAIDRTQLHCYPPKNLSLTILHEQRK